MHCHTVSYMYSLLHTIYRWMGLPFIYRIKPVNKELNKRGALGVKVIVVGDGHGDTYSNHGRSYLYFT